MKNLVSALLLLMASASAFSQTNMYWYNPFGFEPALFFTNGNELITSDTSGQVWFFSYDLLNAQIHVINEAGNINDSMLYQPDPAWANFLFDGRNAVFINIDGLWYQGANGSINPFIIPGMEDSVYSQSQLGMAAAKDGNDYFLSEYINPSGIDSFFVTKYNGSTFQTTYLNGLGIPFNDSTVAATYGFCDNTGAYYVYCKTYGFMKYYQGNWSHITLNIDTLSSYLMTDNSNNIYFTGSVLMKFNGSNLDTIPLPPPANPSPANVLWFPGAVRGSDGNLWVPTESYNGFYRLNADNSWTYIPAPGLDEGYFNNVDIFIEDPASTLFDRKGKFWVTGLDNNIGPYIGVYSFIPFNSISGRVFYDSNGDGICDNGETGFTAMNIVQSTNGYYTNTDTAGDYAVTFLDSAIAHTVSATAPAYYHLTTPASYTVAPGDTLAGYNFGMLANGNIQDLQITAASYWLSPADTFATWISYNNTGTDTESNVITYQYDSRLTYYYAWPAPASISNNILTWNYTDLAPFQGNSIAIVFVSSQNLVAGDTLTSVATIQPVATDTTPGNNVYVNNQVVYASFDPNYKTVSPTGNAAPGQQLTYTIYFQNTGTAPAVNVVVYDTLETNLNPVTFRLLGSSAPVKAALQGPGIVQFTFSNINLPDSAANTALSTGYVQFSVNIVSPLTHTATSVNNAAGVYFDFNAPVETNTATCNLFPTDILPTTTNNSFDIKLQPNPASNEVTIITYTDAIGGTLIIYDALGNRIKEQTINNEITNCSLYSFACGVYLVQIIDTEGKCAFEKLVKE